MHGCELPQRAPSIEKHSEDLLRAIWVFPHDSQGKIPSLGLETMLGTRSGHMCTQHDSITVSCYV